MPKRLNNGAVSKPERVVAAPMSVKGCRLICYGTGIGAGIDHDVNPVIFHGGIQVFFHYGTQAVYLIYEQHVFRFQVGEQPGEVARVFLSRGLRFRGCSPPARWPQYGKGWFLPKPGGPWKRMWSNASPRSLGCFDEDLLGSR